MVGRNVHWDGADDPPAGSPKAFVDRRKSALGVISHDTKRHRRNQIFEDGFDFTLAAAREEMAKIEGGFDRSKVCLRGSDITLLVQRIGGFASKGRDRERCLPCSILVVPKIPAY